MPDPVITYYQVTFLDAFVCQTIQFTPNPNKTVCVSAAVYNGNVSDSSSFASHCATAVPLYDTFPT